MKPLDGLLILSRRNKIHGNIYKKEKGRRQIYDGLGSRVSVNAGSPISLIARLWIASKVLGECLEAPLHKCEQYSRQNSTLNQVKGHWFSWIGLKSDKVVFKRGSGDLHDCFDSILRSIVLCPRLPQNYDVILTIITLLFL